MDAMQVHGDFIRAVCTWCEEYLEKQPYFPWEIKEKQLLQISIENYI